MNEYLATLRRASVDATNRPCRYIEEKRFKAEDDKQAYTKANDIVSKSRDLSLESLHRLEQISLE